MSFRFLLFHFSLVLSLCSLAFSVIVILMFYLGIKGGCFVIEGFFLWGLCSDTTSDAVYTGGSLQCIYCVALVRTYGW